MTLYFTSKFTLLLDDDYSQCYGNPKFYNQDASTRQFDDNSYLLQQPNSLIGPFFFQPSLDTMEVLPSIVTNDKLFPTINGTKHVRSNSTSSRESNYFSPLPLIDEKVPIVAENEGNFAGR